MKELALQEKNTKRCGMTNERQEETADPKKERLNSMLDIKSDQKCPLIAM
ncbi:MAG: hypothetical protein IKK30_00440 [Clostridia bacterium]|nr:hypothetical protein [Clostridia bacterium]